MRARAFVRHLLTLSLAVACATGASTTDRPPREGFLSGGEGARIHYRVQGSAPDTVVAVHGGPGAGMHAILPELEPLAERHTVIFYDQRGGGRSTLPADTALLDARYHVADLEAVRRFFGLERMTVIAHSFGSVLVARYATERPERVERLLFFGAVGPSKEQAVAIARAAAAPPDSALHARLRTVMGALLSGETTDPVADCRAYEAIGREMALARGESGEWEGTNCAMPPEAVRYYFRYTAQLSPRSFGDWDFVGSMDHVEAPLLVVHGDRDPAAAAAEAAWAAAVPNGRALAIPDAGKAVPADRPDLFWPAVETFLAGEWPAGAEAPAQAGRAGAPADTAGLGRLRDDWTRAYEAGDADAMVDLYVPDAVRMPYDAPAVEGREAIVEAYRASFATRRLVPDIELVPVDVEVLGDAAIERGRYHEVLASADGAVRYVEDGKYVSVARRGIDGRWRFSISVFNRDAAP